MFELPWQVFNAIALIKLYTLIHPLIHPIDFVDTISNYQMSYDNLYTINKFYRWMVDTTETSEKIHRS